MSLVSLEKAPPNTLNSDYGRFLQVIFEPADIIEFRLLRDGAKKYWSLPGNCSALESGFHDLNEQGWGVHVGVNPRKEFNASGDASAKLARCLFVDFDDLKSDNKAVEAGERVVKADLPFPTMVVKSGRRGVHCYWRLSEPLDPDNWVGFQERMIKALGSDPVVKNKERLMRLPGFYNLKSDPVLCEIIQADDRKLDILDFDKVLPEIIKPEPIKISKIDTSGFTPMDKRGKAMLYAAKWPGLAEGEEGGRNHTAYAHSQVLLTDFDLDELAALEILEEWNAANTPPLPDKELLAVFNSAKKGGNGKIGSKLVDNRPQNQITRGKNGKTDSEPILIRMSDVEPTEVEWLWSGHFPMGRISLLVGPPGGGKSFITVYAASRVSTGSPWPDGSECPMGSVLLISAEDAASDTIRPRLDAQLADPNRVYLLSMVKKRQGDEEREVLFNLQDVDALEKALRTIPDIRLVVVDPIGSFLGSRVDSHRDSDVRSVLAPISKLAEKYGPAVLIVCHTRKSSAESADDMTLGSRGFVGLARSVWHVMRDRENKNLRLFLPGKNNLAAQSGGMSFSIGGDPPCVMWDKTPVTMTADECIAAQASKPGPDAGERKQAGEWLRNLLSDHGSMPVGDYKQPEEGTIVSESKDAGFTWATMRRAKTDLRIVPYRDQFAGHWRWKLPEEEECPDDP